MSDRGWRLLDGGQDIRLAGRKGEPGGMVYHELWRSLISGVVSRAAGLILVCPDRGDVLLA